MGKKMSEKLQYFAGTFSRMSRGMLDEEIEQ
jgi:hypothetical protein